MKVPFQIKRMVNKYLVFGSACLNVSRPQHFLFPGPGPPVMRTTIATLYTNKVPELKYRLFKKVSKNINFIYILETNNDGLRVSSA